MTAIDSFLLGHAPCAFAEILALAGTQAPNGLNLSDKIAGLSMLLTLLLGVVAIQQARHANRLAQAVARAEHATGSADVRFSWPFGDPDVLYILAAPLQRNRWLELPISCSIANRGQKTAREIEVLVRLPNALCHPDSSAIPVFASESQRIEAKITHRGDNRQSHSICVSSLDPSQAVRVGQAFFVGQETVFSERVSATTRDHHDVSFHVHLAATYIMEVVVLCEDHEPWTAEYKMMVVDTSQRSLAVALEPHNAQMMKRHNDMLDRLRWWQRIRYPIKAEKVRAILVDRSIIDSDPASPIDRVSGDLSIAEGVQLPYGFHIPAAYVRIGE